jgi:RHS repeat-associated protein
VVRYAYDPLGRRITTTSTNGVRRVQTYGLDPNAVAEHSGGDPHTRYTFGLGYDTPLAMSTATSTAYFEQDALSSVTSLTNTAGAVTGRTSYDTYGQITSQTGQVSPYTYTGREHEPAAGLYHYRARWYDPATGTFTSEDPVKTTNLYPYAAANPVRMNDPTGLFGQEDQSAAMAIMQTLARSTFVRQGFINASISAAGQYGRCGSVSFKGVALAFVAGGFLGRAGVRLGDAFKRLSAAERGRALLNFALVQTAVAGYMQIAQTLGGDTDPEDAAGWGLYGLVEAGAAAIGRAGEVADAIATGLGVIAPNVLNPDDYQEDCG